MNDKSVMKPSNFEVFVDPTLYFCVRKIDSKDYNSTLYFNTKEQAFHAVYTFCKWSGYSSTEHDINEIAYRG